MINITEPVTDEQFWIDLENEDRRLKGKKPKHQLGKKDTLTTLLDEIKIAIPKSGDIVQAKYIGIHSDQHCFSVSGFKDDIRVDNKQSENKYLKNLKEGDLIDVLIQKVNEKEFEIQGSIDGIYHSKAHDLLQASSRDNVVVLATIKSLNPAGYDVEITYGVVTLNGFMPNTLAGINKLYNPESIVGKQLQVMIESYSSEEGTYIVSRRKYLKTLEPKALEGLQKYDTGRVYTGNVTGTTPFGIFVEFEECLTGMIHKANVSEEWQNKLIEIVPGTEIDFYVKEIIKDKIILTQIIRETLWDTIKIGQIINGSVRSVKPFGVLVSLDEETVGLVHTSEIDKNVKYVEKQNISVKVLAIDRQNRKIFLTTI